MLWQQHHGRLRLIAASVATMLILMLAGCTSADDGGSSYGDAVTFSGPGLGDFTFEAAGDLR